MSDHSLDISVVDDILHALRIDAFTIGLLVALYCFLASATFIAIHCLLKDGIRSLHNKLNLAAVTVLFGLTTLYTIVQILGVWSEFGLLGADTHSRKLDRNVYRIERTFSQAVFAINVILSDVVILWRAIVIWSWRKRIVYPSIFLLCVTIALWVLAIISSSTVMSIPSSLAISLWATVVVSIKAWQRRRMLRKKVAMMSRYNALENVFNILTESGIVFTLLWVITLIALFPGAFNSQEFANVMTAIMIVAAPLYPTMIVILVAQHKTPISNQLTTIEPVTIMDPENCDLLDADSQVSKELESPALTELQ